MKRLFVGLGNPGDEYARTRHNLGFLVVERFAERQKWPWKEKKSFNGAIAQGVIEGQTICLLRPMTFMNESGRSVEKVKNYFQFQTKDMVVVYDDIGLSFGVLRLRDQGSSGGHRGIESLFDALGTRTFPRLRVGIGHPEKRNKADYVLDRFTQEEELSLDEVIQESMKVLDLLLTDSVEKVMNRINMQKTREKKDGRPSEPSL